jgi:predicted MFS family arabinose efflux permease
MGGLFVLSLLMGTTGSLFYPAVSSLVPDLVPSQHVTAANSWRQLTSQSASIAGRALGGALYALLGIPTLFFVYGTAFFGSALSELFIEAPSPRPAARTSLRGSFGTYLQDTREGFGYVWRQPGLRSLILLVACLNFFFMPVLALLPFFVESTLGAGAKELGWLMASYAGGGMMGSFAAGSPWLARAPRGKVLPACLVLTPPLFAALSLARSPLVGGILLAAIGTLVTIVNIYILTVLQTTTPPELRGRVVGIELGLTRLVSPIGMGLGGVLVDLTGRNMALIYLVCGSAPFLATLVALYLPSFRSFLQQADSPPAPSTDLGAKDAPAA